MKKSKVCLAICSSLVTMSLLTTSYCSVFASGDQAKTGGDLPLTVGVVSDVHLTDDGANKTDETFKNVLQYYKENNVDVLIVTGDIANNGGIASYKRFNDAFKSVYPTAEEAPTKVLVMGNHDYMSMNTSGLTVAQAQERFSTMLGAEPNSHQVIKGYHFIGVSSESEGLDGTFTDTSMDWLKQQLDAAVADDPAKPIFVACHQAVKNTVYGSDQRGNSAFATLLADYPQVVFFSGHSHYPLENERAIYQKDFTAIHVPSLYYTVVETGTATNAYASPEALMFKVEESSMQVKRLKAKELTQIKDVWTLTLPLSKSTFEYTDARADSRIAPEFPAGAKLQVSNVKADSCTLTFPSANHLDYVQGYNVKVTDKATGTAFFNTYYCSDFYLDINNMAETQTVAIKSLVPETVFNIEVTAVESFGKTSKPLSLTFMTSAADGSTPSVAKGDILDCDYSVSMLDNSPSKAPVILFGDGVVGDDASGNAKALLLDGSDDYLCYPYTEETIAKITKQLTMEAAFRTDSLTAQDVIGNRRNGGINLGVDANGNIVAEIRIGSAYKGVSYPIKDSSVYHHVLASYDGTQMKLYVDGVLVDTEEITGDIYYNPIVTRFTVGAREPAGNVKATKFFGGGISLVRLYSTAMSDADAAQAYEYYRSNSQHVAIYQKKAALQNLDLTHKDLTTETRNTLLALIEEAEELGKSVSVTAEQANAFLAKADQAIAQYRSETGADGPSTFVDDMESGFKKVTAKSEGWQYENNKEIGKTLYNKRNNNDVQYLIYQVDNITNFALDALAVQGMGDFGRDIKVYMSDDRITWTPVETVYATPTPDPALAYWNCTTITPKAPLTNKPKYLKVELQSYPEGCPVWTIALDKISIESNGNVNPTDPSNPTNPTDPTNPTNPTDPTNPTNPTNPTGTTDPSDSPQTGDWRSFGMASVLLLISAGGLFLLCRRKEMAA